MSEDAIEIRRQWMTLMGIDPNEIEKFCASEQVLSLEEELLELEAAKRLKEKWKHLDLSEYDVSECD